MIAEGKKLAAEKLGDIAGRINWYEQTAEEYKY